MKLHLVSNIGIIKTVSGHLFALHSVRDPVKKIDFSIE